MGSQNTKKNTNELIIQNGNNKIEFAEEKHEKQIEFQANFDVTSRPDFGQAEERNKQYLKNEDIVEGGFGLCCAQTISSTVIC